MKLLAWRALGYRMIAGAHVMWVLLFAQLLLLLGIVANVAVADIFMIDAAGEAYLAAVCAVQLGGVAWLFHTAYSHASVGALLATAVNSLVLCALVSTLSLSVLVIDRPAHVNTARAVTLAAVSATGCVVITPWVCVRLTDEVSWLDFIRHRQRRGSFDPAAIRTDMVAASLLLVAAGHRWAGFETGGHTATAPLLAIHWLFPAVIRVCWTWLQLREGPLPRWRVVSFSLFGFAQAPRTLSCLLEERPSCTHCDASPCGDSRVYRMPCPSF